MHDIHRDCWVPQSHVPVASHRPLLQAFASDLQHSYGLVITALQKLDYADTTRSGGVSRCRRGAHRLTAWVCGVLID